MPSDTPTYRPVGRVYQVEFLDGRGYTWNQNVAIPADQGVEEVLRILQTAYPGRSVKSLIVRDDIHHGHIARQKYHQEER